MSSGGSTTAHAAAKDTNGTTTAPGAHRQRMRRGHGGGDAPGSADSPFPDGGEGAGTSVCDRRHHGGAPMPVPTPPVSPTRGRADGRGRDEAPKSHAGAGTSR